MKPLFRAASLCLVFLSSARADWPQATSDLKADPKATFGQLENGLRYIILPNEEPPGRASIRFYMDVGSLMEEDDQQGMAHYLEHMAFNGSRHFPGGEMVEYFQRLGMGFGADTNAHTSFKETVYMLELPKIEIDMLNEGLKLFRDDLDGMALGEKEIDKERGIILSEKLSRDSIEYRTQIAGYEFALPDSLLPKRLPIGIEKTIKTMQRQRFVDFYSKWYTPKRATVVAVGDFKDVPAVKAAIEKNFADAKSSSTAEDPTFGKITAGRGLMGKLHTEMEAKAVDLSIEIPRPAKNKPDTSANRREKMVRDLADAMLNQRFSTLAKEENTPILGAESYCYEYLEFVEITGAMAQCPPDQWKRGVTLLETEIRRAVEHGFTDAEFEEAKSSLLKAIELRAAQADSRKSRDLASALVTLVASNKVITHPTDDLERVKAALANLTKEECHKAFVETWKSEDIQVFVGGKLKLEGDSSQQIVDVYKESAKKPVEAPKKEETAAFAYTNFGEASKITNQSVVSDLEITQATFANNVRVNIKPTPFEKGTVRVTIGFGGGKLTTPKDKAGIIPFAQSTFILGGLKDHSADDLRRLFASKTVAMDFNVGDESFTLSGRTTPADLEAQLQLLTAFLTAPGYREEAERQFRQNIEPMYIQLAHTAEGIMGDKVVSHIHSGDYRFGFPAQAEMEKRNLKEVAEWLKPALTEDYIEVSIVGDVEPKAALDAIGKTLGALPKRAAEKPKYTAERNVPFPSPGSTDFKFETEIPKAIACLYWPTGDMLDIKRTRRLNLLSAVLDDRLRIKVREELGETYSPACYHVASDTFTGYGYVTAMIECKPEQAASLSELVTKIANDLSTGEITDDEFERAQKPIMTQVEQMRRDNRYWAQNVVRNAQEHPERIEWSKNLLTDFSGIKKEDISKLAQQFLGKGRAVNVVVMPEKK
ncbi:M16 family metallopeptidase [Brevifollis gellanilyticus]|uniref:Peptidase M16 n=1 Tax=Brevifollis gellanilyticus TaxID=748831 RepID=A0A512MB95_9BACT|nr:M16 family metallopeptidase [Brevifollis gellanilyticus]GEP44005.1 peptidase M16 [Brevifollis gellanilyticus]